MNPSQAVLTTAYLPPLEYYSILLGYNELLVEHFDTYAKQTYRNRCLILSANGLLPLVIPVVKPNGSKTLTKDVLIDNSVKWQREHWRAIVSAYKRSAYFDYIADDLEPFYTKKWKYLSGYNMQIINTINGILGVSPTISYTEHFLMDYPGGVKDFRFSIRPKPSALSDSKEFKPTPYFQVFATRFGFTPNLSILDMLCNAGLESLMLIRGG